MNTLLNGANIYKDFLNPCEGIKLVYLYTLSTLEVKGNCFNKIIDLIKY